MRKNAFGLFLLIIFSIYLLSCEKKESEPTEQTFFVHVMEKLTPDSKPKPIITTGKILVSLFKDTGKEINYDESVQYSSDWNIVYSDGSRVEADYTELGAITTFENVPNGNYILWVHVQDGSFISRRSSRKISINRDLHLKTIQKVFKTTEYGYKEWDEL